MSVIDDIDDIKSSYTSGDITREEAVVRILDHSQTEMSAEAAGRILDQPGSYQDAAMGALRSVRWSGVLRGH